MRDAWTYGRNPLGLSVRRAGGRGEGIGSNAFCNVAVPCRQWLRTIK